MYSSIEASVFREDRGLDPCKNSGNAFITLKDPSFSEGNAQALVKIEQRGLFLNRNLELVCEALQRVPLCCKLHFCALRVFNLLPSANIPVRTAKFRVSDILPGLLTAKCLDTALVMCPTPGARICRPKECHPAVQDEIVGDVLGSSHRQPNPIWTRG